MQWVQFHQNGQVEEARIDQLARRFALTGSMFCAFIVAAAWLSTLAG